MPLPGPAPKPADQRRDRHEKAALTIKIEDVPFTDAPALPDRNPESNSPWTSNARGFWDTLSSMPHCCLWSDMDWEYAVQTVCVYERTRTPGNEGMGAHRELRFRDKVLGMTFDARRCLRIEYVAPADAQEPTRHVDDLAARRRAID